MSKKKFTFQDLDKAIEDYKKSADYIDIDKMFYLFLPEKILNDPELREKVREMYPNAILSNQSFLTETGDHILNSMELSETDIETTPKKTPEEIKISLALGFINALQEGK